MQNKYFGDIGDFGKYSLLRQVQKEAPKLRIGINWYLNEDETKNKDGKHIGFLNLKKRDFKFRFIDEDLYNNIRKIIFDKKKRDIKYVKEAKILKLPFSEFSKPVPIKKEREKWFTESLNIFKREKCKLLFLDPDNQVQIPSNLYSKKHIRYEEIQRYWREGFSLILYNHKDRKVDYLEKICNLASKLDLKGASTDILEYAHGTQRHYIFLMQKGHQKELEFLFKKGNDLFKKQFFRHLKN